MRCIVYCLLGFFANTIAADLTILVKESLNNLDPMFQGLGSQNFLAFSGVYETLVKLDSSGNYQPYLLASYEQVNPTTWKLVLRDSVTFSDGSPLTAKDVVFSLNRKRKSQAAFMDAWITCREISQHEVELQSQKPANLLLLELSKLEIMSQQWAADHDVLDKTNDFVQTHMLGSGPYELTDHTDSQLVLKMRRDYWDPDLYKNYAEFDRLIFETEASEDKRMQAMYVGHADINTAVAVEHYKKIEEDPRFRLGLFGSGDTLHIYTNQLQNYLFQQPYVKNALREPKVRKAISMSINRSKHLDAVYGKYADPILVPFWEGMFGYESTYSMDDALYNPDQAKALLRESHQENLKLRLACPPAAGYPERVVLCQSIAQDLREVGIQAETHTVGGIFELLTYFVTGTGYDLIMLAYPGGGPYTWPEFGKAHQCGQTFASAFGFCDSEFDSQLNNWLHSDDPVRDKGYLMRAAESWVDASHVIDLGKFHSLAMAIRGDLQIDAILHQRRPDFWKISVAKT